MTVYPHFSSVSSHHATLPPTLCRTCHCKPSDTLQVSSLQLSACPLILVPSDCLKGALLSWLRLYPTMRFSLSLPATALGACLLSKVHLECQARAVLLIWIQWSFGICFSNGICNFLNQRPLIQGFQYAAKFVPQVSHFPQNTNRTHIANLLSSTALIQSRISMCAQKSARMPMLWQFHPEGNGLPLQFILV